MIRRGMTREQVEEMMVQYGWELYEDDECDEYCPTIIQGDHAVGIVYDDDWRVEELEAVALWDLQ